MERRGFHALSISNGISKPKDSLTYNMLIIAAKKLPMSDPGGHSAQQGTQNIHLHTQSHQKSVCCVGTC